MRFVRSEGALAGRNLHAAEAPRSPDLGATEVKFRVHARDDVAQQGGAQVRAVHVIAGLDVAYGGPSYSVPRLCEALAAAGAELTLLSVAATAQGRCDTSEKGYRDRRFALDYSRIPSLRGLRSSSGLAQALHSIATHIDVVHDHGLWLMPNVQAGRAAARARKPFVVSPRGMLSPAALAFSRIKKEAFWRLLQGPAIRQAACLHATSAQEYDEIRAFGLANPVAVIANGIDLPDPAAAPAARPAAERVALSLGRIHPKKGLDRLLRAWAEVEARHPRWRLRLAGPSEAGYADELHALALALGLARVSIDGPIYDDLKWDAYRAADLFVLPSLNENFGLAVAEALAAGTPAISTKGAPWSGLEGEGCGWWIDHGVEPLATALARAMAMPPESLNGMGAKGRAWMARDFSWDRAARDMLDVYRWLTRDTEPPSTTRLD
jgi:glycosyltransferase involved in cell wall biosynthesis